MAFDDSVTSYSENGDCGCDCLCPKPDKTITLVFSEVTACDCTAENGVSRKPDKSSVEAINSAFSLSPSSLGYGGWLLVNAIKPSANDYSDDSCQNDPSPFDYYMDISAHCFRGDWMIYVNRGTIPGGQGSGSWVFLATGTLDSGKSINNYTTSCSYSDFWAKGGKVTLSW